MSESAKLIQDSIEKMLRKGDLSHYEAMALNAQVANIILTQELIEEIQGLRQDLANEPDPDAEPDPFQTLNGPAKKATGCGAQIVIEGWGGFCGETDMGQTLPTLCVDCGGPFQTLNGPRL